MSRISISQLGSLWSRGRGGPRNLPPFDLAPAGRQHGVYLAGNEHERVQVLTLRLPLLEVLTRIQGFLRRKLHKWEKRDENVSAAGPNISTLYAYAYAPSFPLKPKTFRAHWNVVMERQKTGRGTIVRNIPYEIELRLEIEQHFPDTVVLQARLSEKIDPQGKLSDYPIGHHFWAPSVIHTESWFDDFLALFQDHA